MSLTLTDNLRTVAGDRRVVVATILFDDSYPTGGEAITAATFGLSSIDSVLPFPHASRIAVWDRTNSKVLLYTALGTEASDTSDQSSITIRVQVIGR